MWERVTFAHFRVSAAGDHVNKLADVLFYKEESAKENATPTRKADIAMLDKR